MRFKSILIIMLVLIMVFSSTVPSLANSKGRIMLKDAGGLDAPGNEPKFEDKRDVWVEVTNMEEGDYTVEVFEPGKQVSLGDGEIAITSSGVITFNLYNVTRFDDSENNGGVYYVQVGSVKSKNFKIKDFEEEQSIRITINYEANTGGEVSRDSETLLNTGVAKGSTATADEGYVFVNWLKDGLGVSTETTFVPEKVDGLHVAATYVANFALEEEEEDVTWDVKFKAGPNGSLTGEDEFLDILDGTIWEDAEITIPEPVPTSGYEFDEWTPAIPNDDTAIESNLTFTASFVKEKDNGDPALKWDVTFEAGAHGSLTGNNEFLNIPNGTSWGAITVPTPVPAFGYEFDEWTPSFPNTITKDWDFTAIFKEKSAETTTTTTSVTRYTVTFEDFDGEVLKTQRVRRGNDATPPEEPTRVGYIFKEWDGNWTNVRRNETVVATYEEIIIDEPIIDEPIIEEPIVEEPVVIITPAPIVTTTTPISAPTTLPKTGAGIDTSILGYGLLGLGAIIRRLTKH